MKTKKTRIFIYGGHWAKILSDFVNDAKDPFISAFSIQFPSVNPFRLTLSAFKADIIMRVGVRPGGPGKRIMILDILWNTYKLIWPHKSFVYYWIGTDVMLALEDKKQTQNHFFLNASKTSKHYANAPWLMDELSQLNIKSDVVLFPAGKVFPPTDDRINWPAKFTVMTYIPDRRHTFYGGEEFVEAARRLRNVEFIVTEGDGGWVKNKPNNIIFLGHRNDMGEIFNSAHVVVRQVQHDAIGGTVREALFYARHVIYSYPLPFTNFVAWKDVDNLVRIISNFYSRHTAGTLQPNLEGRRYALDQWEPKRMTHALIKNLRSLQ